MGNNDRYRKRFKEMEAHSGLFIEQYRDQSMLLLNEIETAVREVLDKCGFYYNISSRMKSWESLTKKLSRREEDGSWYYDGERKVQDLFGVRILIYFIEDMSILQGLLNETFSSVGDNWTKRKYEKDRFKAISINGVFNLDGIVEDKNLEELKSVVNPHMVDTTFEIQLRTVSFEAWHEIEHDYSYKFNNMWSEQEELLRRFHSVLATFELCDDTMVNTLENLAYDVYSRKRHTSRYKDEENRSLVSGVSSEEDDGEKKYTLSDWDRMIRAHFRLRIKYFENPKTPDRELIPLFYELMDDEESQYAFAKYVLRFRKENLVRLLITPEAFLKKIAKERGVDYEPIFTSFGEFNDRIEINVNTIIILIMLYRDAREGDASNKQRQVLAGLDQKVKQLVFYEGRKDNYASLGLKKKLVEEAWTTLQYNNLLVNADCGKDEWKNKFKKAIIDSYRFFFPKELLSVEPGDSLIYNEDTRYVIHETEDTLSSVAYYKGTKYKENKWRQLLIIKREGDSSYRVRIYVQYYSNKKKGTGKQKNSEAPFIHQLLIFKTFNESGISIAKPVITEQGDIRFLVDLVNVRKKENRLYLLKSEADRISFARESHPVIVFAFRDKSAFVKGEYVVALFEHEIGSTAYIYAAVEDEDSDEELCEEGVYVKEPSEISAIDPKTRLIILKVGRNMRKCIEKLSKWLRYCNMSSVDEEIVNEMMEEEETIES